MSDRLGHTFHFMEAVERTRTAAEIEDCLLRLAAGFDSNLTAREWDHLLWAGEGKTNWEISVILGISKPTVTKHIIAAR